MMLQPVCHRILVAAAVCAGVANLADAAVVNVPDPGNSLFTIQQGIDAAANGDQVVVAPGSYTELVTLNGKAITLRSTDPTSPTVVATTIINGGGAGTVVTCMDEEGPSTVITGFTITGGNGQSGGGMYFENASPSVTHCRIVGNVGTYGGGILASQCASNVRNCTFENNQAIGTGSAGGAIYVMAFGPYNFSVSNSSFTGNYTDQLGGAIYTEGIGIPSVTNCQFNDNTADIRGGGLYSRTKINVTGCTFNGNTSGGAGGGMVFDSIDSQSATDCTFIQNTADTDGGGLLLLDAEATITDCTFSQNSAQFDGGGVAVLRYTNGPFATSFSGCTFTNNDAAKGGGASVVVTTTPTIAPTFDNCNFAANTSPLGNDLRSSSGGQLPQIANTTFCGTLPGAVNGPVNFGMNNMFEENCGTQGACCVSGGCLMMNSAECQVAGGVYQGDGVSCGSIACDVHNPGDLDGDGDSDLADYAVFSQMFTGPN